jgi:hypothetical protein
MLTFLSTLLTIGHGQSDDSALLLIFIWLLTIPITLILAIWVQYQNEFWLRFLTLVFVIVSGPIWVIAMAINVFAGLIILCFTATSIFLLIRAHGKKNQS